MLGASPNIIRAAQDVGPRILFVDRTPPRGLSQQLRNDRDQFFTVDYLDDRALDDFAGVLVDDLAPDVVLSVTESGLLPAARLTSLLGLRGTTVETVRLMRDKLAMRARLAERAPSLAWPATEGTDDASVAALIERHGMCIIKPVDGTGSRGVRRIADASELATVPSAERSGTIVEKLAVGVEVSVEAMSREGQHTVVAVAEKRTSAEAVEVAHLVPAPSLSAADLAWVTAATQDCLSALGLEEGPSHTELFVSPEQVMIVETHNRPGGDGIADLVQLTTGIDWRRASMAWPAEPLEGSATERGAEAAAAAMVSFTAPPGIVRSVCQEPPQFPGARVVSWHVDVAVGERVGPLLSSADRVGAARLVGESPQALAAAVEALLACDVVKTEETVA